MLCEWNISSLHLSYIFNMLIFCFVEMFCSNAVMCLNLFPHGLCFSLFCERSPSLCQCHEDVLEHFLLKVFLKGSFFIFKSLSRINFCALHLIIFFPYVRSFSSETCETAYFFIGCFFKAVLSSLQIWAENTSAAPTHAEPPPFDNGYNCSLWNVSCYEDDGIIGRKWDEI